MSALVAAGCGASVGPSAGVPDADVVTPPALPECTSGAQCASGVCSSQGRCVSGCQTDAQCPRADNWRCVTPGGGGGPGVCACTPNEVAIEDRCGSYDHDCDGAVEPAFPCFGLASCQSGRCVCGAGQTRCNGQCVDLQSDQANCGACGSACPWSLQCVDGRCGCGRGLPRDQCGDACVDFATDPANCGACGNVCTGQDVCVAGACACPAETPSRCGGLCYDLQSDPRNCGACGNSCGAGEACRAGVCACDPGTTRCGGVCADLAGDEANCGACGAVCAGVCVEGRCTSTVREITAGGDHTCALLASGSLYCWGRNDHRELSAQPDAARTAPRFAEVSGLSGVTGVSAGGSHTCARTSGGVACFGWNNLDQVRYQGVTFFRDLSPVADPVPGTSELVSVTAGRLHNCGIAADGRVWCWGNDADAQSRGDLGFPRTARPERVRSVDMATQLALGDDHSCALRSDGSVYCWGANEHGQCGAALTVRTASVTAITGMDAVQIAAGGDHTCAVLRDGTVRCWGANTFGQLGDGTRTTSSEPVRVLGITDAAAVTAGGWSGGGFTCVLSRDGTARCFGRNDRGQLGVGLATWSVPVPTAVSGLTGASQLVAGRRHACALRRDASEVVCWGDNRRQQLNDGTTASRAAPTTVVWR